MIQNKDAASTKGWHNDPWMNDYVGIYSTLWHIMTFSWVFSSTSQWGEAN